MLSFTPVVVQASPPSQRSKTVTQVTGLSDRGLIIGDAGEPTGTFADMNSFSYSMPNQSLAFFAHSGVTTFPTVNSQALDVNASGQIVGEYTNNTASSSTSSGYLYSGGVLIDLNVPGAFFTAAEGITYSGTIVGFFGDGAGNHGFIRTPDGTYNTFDVPPSFGGHDTEFVDVNDNAQVLGVYFASGVERSFEYNTTTATYAPLIFSGDQTVLTRINDLGEAIGSFIDGSGVSHGLLFDGSNYTVIDDPLAIAGGTQLADINDKGQIVGTYVDSNRNSHGFLYSGGAYQTIDEPSGIGSTQVQAINDLGQIAGSYVAADGTQTMFYAQLGPASYDLNADGISDLVFQNSGQPGIWLWNGSAPTAEVGLANPGPSWHIVASRDINGDGTADLIWQNSDGTPGVWLMNGTTPVAEVAFTNPGASWHLVASGDTNGDGKSDLIWRNADGTLGVWLMNGTTPIAEAGIGNPGANWKVVGTADYNGDLHEDILLQDSTTGNLMIDLMNGTSITSSVSIAVGDPSWHAVSTGVFKGVTEIAWQNSNGTPGIWLMNGTTPTNQAALSNPGPGWQLISIDHFTPNGQADLLFQNSNGAMMLYEMNGTSVAAQVNLPNAGPWQSVNGHPFTAMT